MPTKPGMLCRSLVRVAGPQWFESALAALPGSAWVGSCSVAPEPEPNPGNSSVRDMDRGVSSAGLSAALAWQF